MQIVLIFVAVQLQMSLGDETSRENTAQLLLSGSHKLLGNSPPCAAPLLQNPLLLFQNEEDLFFFFFVIHLPGCAAVRCSCERMGGRCILHRQNIVCVPGSSRLMQGLFVFCFFIGHNVSPEGRTLFRRQPPWEESYVTTRIMSMKTAHFKAA